MHDKFWTEMADVAGDARTDATLNGVRISTRVIHAGEAIVGGDWCEAFVVSDGCIALSVGDVCGHGAESYEAMVVARLAIRAAAFAGHDPLRTLEAADQVLERWRPATYATAIFALIDTRRRTLLFANAGHPPPLVVGRQETAYLRYASSDVPLGLGFPTPLQLRRMAMPAETLLVLYTDGATEHARRPLLGETSLGEAASFAFEHPTHSTATVIERHIGLIGPAEDDIAILTAWL